MAFKRKYEVNSQIVMNNEIIEVVSNLNTWEAKYQHWTLKMIQITNLKNSGMYVCVEQ